MVVLLLFNIYSFISKSYLCSSLVSEHAPRFTSVGGDIWVDYRFGLMPVFCFVFLRIMAHSVVRIPFP